MLVQVSKHVITLMETDSTVSVKSLRPGWVTELQHEVFQGQQLCGLPTFLCMCLCYSHSSQC